ncbi:MAG: ABC transporter ATP-binding protein [Huintestinicola sp.]
MAKSSVVFDIKNVSKQFGIKRKTIQALTDINLQVKKNEFVALLGTSGCGKSTLLRMLCGLDFPTTGEILADGKRITGPGMDRGMVFQGYTLFPWMSVLDNVAYGLKSRKIGKEEREETARKFIADIGLSEFENVYPSELSGGMRQRVAIARALAANPDSLLLDEPFGALDAQTRRSMQELTLQMWRKYPKTVIMVTHDVDEAVLMADRVIVMSAHPGCIREIVNIDIPRPRTAEVKRTEKFIEYKRHCTDIILEESRKVEMMIEDN